MPTIIDKRQKTISLKELVPGDSFACDHSTTSTTYGIVLDPVGLRIPMSFGNPVDNASRGEGLVPYFDIEAGRVAWKSGEARVSQVSINYEIYNL